MELSERAFVLSAPPSSALGGERAYHVPLPPKDPVIFNYELDALINDVTKTDLSIGNMTTGTATGTSSGVTSSGQQNRNAMVDLQSLLVALTDPKCARKFDEKLVKEIYSSGTRKLKNRVPLQLTWREFFTEYLEERHEVACRLVAATAEAAEYDRDANYCETQLRNLVNPTLDKLVCQIVSITSASAGVASGAATEGMMIRWKPQSLYKLHLDCQHQVIETQTTSASTLPGGGVNSSSSSSSSSPLQSMLWNEIFAFVAKPDEGNLKITLMEIDQNNDKLIDEEKDWRSSNLGVEIDLEKVLGDQGKKCLSLPLIDAAGEGGDRVGEDGGALLPHLNMNIQWLRDEKTFYEQRIVDFRSRRINACRDAREREILLNRYDLPFGGRSNRYVSAIGGNARRKLIDTMKHPSQSLSLAVDQAMQKFNATNYQTASKIMCSIFMILCCLGGFSRACFADLTVGAFAFWSDLDFRRWTLKSYLWCILGLIYTIILDLVWFFYNFSVWIRTSEDANVYIVTKVFAIVLIIWKIILAVLYWKCRHDLKEYGFVPTNLTMTH